MKQIAILMPSDHFDPRRVDADFAPEWEAVSQMPEFLPVLYAHDMFVTFPALRMTPDLRGVDMPCIGRMWMFTVPQYRRLYSGLNERGLHLSTAPGQYGTFHLFPNAYPYIEQDTPKALWYPDGAAIDWPNAFDTLGRFRMKDYVKSEKGTSFPQCFVPSMLPRMEEYHKRFLELRGTQYIGGIVLKEYVSLKHYGSATNEYRAFYLNGQVLSVSPNSSQPAEAAVVPQALTDKYASLPSPFYTVDFAELEDGKWIVLETGDGQVSGLSPNQNVFAFYEGMKRILLAQDEA